MKSISVEPGLRRLDTARRGGRKDLFYENENFSHNKFGASLAFVARVLTRQHGDSSSRVSTAGDLR
jgi:hypothetical protein